MEKQYIPSTQEARMPTNVRRRPSEVMGMRSEPLVNTFVKSVKDQERNKRTKRKGEGGGEILFFLKKKNTNRRGPPNGILKASAHVTGSYCCFFSLFFLFQ